MIMTTKKENAAYLDRAKSFSSLFKKEAKVLQSRGDQVKALDAELWRVNKITMDFDRSDAL